jgi:hypothetical protein
VGAGAALSHATHARRAEALEWCPFRPALVSDETHESAALSGVGRCRRLPATVRRRHRGLELFRQALTLDPENKKAKVLLGGDPLQTLPAGGEAAQTLPPGAPPLPREVAPGDATLFAPPSPNERSAVDTTMVGRQLGHKAEGETKTREHQRKKRCIRSLHSEDEPPSDLSHSTDPGRRASARSTSTRSPRRALGPEFETGNRSVPDGMDEGTGELTIVEPSGLLVTRDRHVRILRRSVLVADGGSATLSVNGSSRCQGSGCKLLRQKK